MKAGGQQENSAAVGLAAVENFVHSNVQPLLTLLFLAKQVEKFSRWLLVDHREQNVCILSFEERGWRREILVSC